MAPACAPRPPRLRSPSMYRCTGGGGRLDAETHLTSTPYIFKSMLSMSWLHSLYLKIPPPPRHHDVRHVQTQATSTAGGLSGRSVSGAKEKKALGVHYPDTPPARNNPGGGGGPGQGCRAVRASDGGEAARCLCTNSGTFLPSPRSKAQEGPPTSSCGHSKWKLQRQGGPALAVLEEGVPGASHPARGVRPGSSPPGCGPLRPHSGSRPAARAKALSAAGTTMDTAPRGLCPWMRSPWARCGGWITLASRRSALGESPPRPPATRRSGVGRRSAHPTPLTPTASRATLDRYPSWPPTPAPAATRPD